MDDVSDGYLWWHKRWIHAATGSSQWRAGGVLGETSMDGWMDGWKLSGIVSGVLWMFLIVLLSLLVGCFECVFLVSKCNREELWDFGIFSIDRKSGTHETLYQNHPWKRGISGGRITTPIQSTRYRKDITLGCTNSLRMYLSKSKSKISRFQINIEYWRAHIYTVGSLEVASIHLQASVNVGI